MYNACILHRNKGLTRVASPQLSLDPFLGWKTIHSRMKLAKPSGIPTRQRKKKSCESSFDIYQLVPWRDSPNKLSIGGIPYVPWHPWSIHMFSLHLNLDKSDKSCSWGFLV